MGKPHLKTAIQIGDLREASKQLSRYARLYESMADEAESFGLKRLVMRNAASLVEFTKRLETTSDKHIADAKKCCDAARDGSPQPEPDIETQDPEKDTAKAKADMTRRATKKKAGKKESK